MLESNPPCRSKSRICGSTHSLQFPLTQPIQIPPGRKRNAPLRQSSVSTIVPLFCGQIIISWYNLLFCCVASSQKYFNTNYFSVRLMKLVLRSVPFTCHVPLYFYLYYYLIDQCRQNARIL